MKIRYSNHFEEKMKLRSISRELAENIFSQADNYFEDIQTQTFAAVKRIFFKGKERDIALVYRESGNEVLFITIHPLREKQKENRIQRGRWRKI